MKNRNKLILLTLALVVFTSAVYCQSITYPVENNSTPMNPYLEGTAAGKADAEGSIAYGCGGLVCGVLGIVAAAVSDPEPDPAKVNYLLQNKGAEYMSAYSNAYSKEARKKNITYAAVGWGVSVVAGSVYYIIAVAAAVNELNNLEKHPVKIGVSLPLGKISPNYNHGN